MAHCRSAAAAPFSKQRLAAAGNHALGLAYHGKLLGIPVTVVMPKFAPLIKITTCQKLGERNLPNLWVPKERDFYLVDELPLLGTGKLDLRRLKEMALKIVDEKKS